MGGLTFRPEFAKAVMAGTKTQTRRRLSDNPRSSGSKLPLISAHRVFTPWAPNYPRTYPAESLEDVVALLQRWRRGYAIDNETGEQVDVGLATEGT